MGPCAVWLTEALCQTMQLEAGMRVLDMGCGKAMSSVFLAREFGVQVWANDLWIQATENQRRIEEAGVADRVFPVHAEAHALPYAEGFFDAIVSVDSYHYYGTDDLYLPHFIKFLRPGGQIGIVVPGFVREFGREIPEHLDPVYYQEWYSLHTAEWWRWHWEKTRLVEIERAELIPDGFSLWLRWEETCDSTGHTVPAGQSDAEVLRADGGQNIGLVRLVGRRLVSQ
jgi:SAM-dependent methyltransferase